MALKDIRSEISCFFFQLFLFLKKKENDFHCFFIKSHEISVILRGAAASSATRTEARSPSRFVGCPDRAA